VSGQELHLRDYLRILRKRRLSTLAVFALILAGVAVYLQAAAPVYRASTSLLIEKGEPYNISLTNSYYVNWDPQFFQTQAHLIRSAAIAEKTADMLFMDPAYLELPSRGEKGAEVETAAGLAERIRGGISVIPVPESKIFTVSFTSGDPALAALVANTVAEAYRVELLEMNIRSSQHAIEWLSRKSEEEAGRLGEAEKALQDYMKKNDIISMEYRLESIPPELSEMSVQLAKAESKRKELEMVQDLVSSSMDPSGIETLPVVEGDPAVQELKSQVLRAEQVIMEHSKKYGPKHPVMKAAVADLETLKTKKAEEVRRIVDSVEKEYELARSREENLRERLEALKAEAFRLKEQYVQYEMLKVAAETNRQFYDTLFKKTKEHTLMGQIQNIKVSVIEHADLPTRPVRPNKLRILILGLAAALLGGVAMAFFLEYLDNTVHTPEEAQEKTGAPVLGIIPLLTERGREIEKVVLEEPRAAISERYKALRASVLLSPAAANGRRSLLVTSMVPEEGKTASAVNLAVSLAQSGYGVILVDADLRKPRVHRVFDLAAEKGLSTFLSGLSKEPAVLNTEVENLSVLPAGPRPPNPSELLSSKRMKELVAFLKKEYDIVVFDSSPTLTVADSLILSKEADSTLLVVRAGKTTYDLLRRGLKSFTDVDTEILGIVMNAVDEKKNGYYYYSKYDAYYSGDKARNS
jgi:capsular exopolysaccharide synthesis family protein